MEFGRFDVLAFCKRISRYHVAHFAGRSQDDTWLHPKAFFNGGLNSFGKLWQVFLFSSKYDISALDVRLNVLQFERLIERAKVRHFDDGCAADVDRTKK